MTDPRRNDESPSDNPSTSGSSTIVCPIAHSTPARQLDLAARRVDARKRGPGVSAPEELAMMTEIRNSEEIRRGHELVWIINMFLFVNKDAIRKWGKAIALPRTVRRENVLGS